jgi:hypothetical protein
LNFYLNDPSISGRVVRLLSMKYLMLLYASLPPEGSAELADLLADWHQAEQEMADAGVLLECGPLQPAEASTTVRVRDGQTLVTDGPAAEIKEHFGGITLIECGDLDEALKWASRLPTARNGSVEVRPLIAVDR